MLAKLRMTCRRLAAMRYAPFLVVAVVGQTCWGWPTGSTTNPGWAVAAVAVFGVICAAVLLIERRRLDGWIAAVPPMALLLIIAFWRQAYAGVSSGFAPLVVLPVLWFALHGSRRQVWLAVGGVAALFEAPLAIAGGPDYPLDDWRRGLLWVVVLGFIGPTVHTLVRQRGKQAERVAALQPKESRLEALLRAATAHSIVATDLDGRITVFNAGAQRMLGWSAEEMVGQRTERIQDPAQLAARSRAQAAESALGLVIDAEQAHHEARDWAYITKDGQRITVSLSVTDVRDDTNSLTGHISIATDVTENRRAVNVLEAQREIYELLVQHLPLTTVGVLNESLQWINVFGHWTADRGIPEAELTGSDFDRYLSSVDADLIAELYSTAFKRPVHKEMRSSAGRWLEIDGVPIAGPDGQRLVLSVIRDVTESHDAELERQQIMTALAVSEESFRTTFEGAPIGIAVTTADEWSAERFVRVNAAFGRILGRTPDELAGQLVADVTHPDDRHIVNEKFNDDVPTRHLQKRFTHSSGRPVWVRLFYSLVKDPDGRPSYLINHAEDITTHKESERALFEALERQRAATEGMRGLDRIRTEVVSTISHELRTPLTSIGGYLEMLGDGDAGLLNVDQKRMIDVASRNADRLASIVDDLLALAKFDANDMVVDHELVRVRELLANAADTVLPVFEKHCQFLHIADVSPAFAVIGDAVQLDRALVNLLANASKFSADGGHVRVDAYCEDGEVRIAVSDDGIGVEADQQDKLFDRFFRGSSAQEHPTVGTGLGLAIVKSIVDRHHGRIAVRSVPDEGSTFTIVLPHAPVTAVIR